MYFVIVFFVHSGFVYLIAVVEKVEVALVDKASSSGTMDNDAKCLLVASRHVVNCGIRLC